MTISSSATIITFDDLPLTSGTDSSAVPAGYGGINWLPSVSGIPPFTESEWLYFSENGTTFLPHSSPNRAFTEAIAGESLFSFIDGAQVFNGAWLSGNELSTVQFFLYSGDLLVHTSDVLSLTHEAAFLSSGYDLPVTAVGILPSSFFAIDDIEYGNSDPVTPMPEPASVALVSSCIALLALHRARKNLS